MSKPQTFPSTSRTSLGDEGAPPAVPHPPVLTRTQKAKNWAATLLHHARKHTGTGVVCSVAYFDPGNWSVDLEAGSEFGYKLLFVILLSGLMAAVLQAMAARLGCVTGMDLATHCRMLLYNRPKHTLLYRWLLLYPLYCLCEIAIISTDLAELVGSATALVLLFPALPIWAGVLLTAVDVMLILAVGDPTRGRPVKLFELLIAVLVAATFASLIVVIVKVSPDWGEAFYGFVPSNTVFKPGALYTSVGIIGATVMPHGLFLGSSLATQDRISEFEKLSSDSASDLPRQGDVRASAGLIKRVGSKVWQGIRSLKAKKITDDQDLPDCSRGHAGWRNNSESFVRAHLNHGIADVVMSLLGFAVAINALILILAGAVFFYGSGRGSSTPASLFEAHDLIRDYVGKPAAFLFTLALLCAGESASITATLAGQVVCEGFLRWRVSPIIRRLITRLLGLIPSMLVAIIVGRSGLNALLVASQVILSVVLPFVAFPLVYLTSSSKIMSAPKDVVRTLPPAFEDDDPKAAALKWTKAGAAGESGPSTQVIEVEMVDHSNGKIMMGLGYAIWLVVLVANGYVLVTLAIGEGS